MTLAIDFGTSNTVVARWNAAAATPETLALPELSRRQAGNPPVVPSLLYVQQLDPLQLRVGQQVLDGGLDVAGDARFFRNFKRGIGAAQGFRPQLEGQALSFEQVGQWFLTQVLAQVGQIQSVEGLIFTVPVDSFEAYRHWLAAVSQELAVEQVRLVDEPTAAALGYGLSGSQTLLVVDFGGGTLDFSLVQLQAPAQKKPLGLVLRWGGRDLQDSPQRVDTARVLAKGGENLGGADIDNWLADHFRRELGLEPTPVIMRLVERLKIQLSCQPRASEAYFNDETLETYELALDRPQFELLLREHQLFERLEQRLQGVLQQGRRQGVAPEDIEAVLLVGGSAQIPAVQDWLRQRFGERVRCDRPFEAVAQGALQLADIELQDFLYHGYGVRYWDRRRNGHGWHPIIPQGQPYPMQEPIELLLGASVEQQPSIELVLGEMGESSGRTEVYFEGDRLITRQVGGEGAVRPLNDTDGGRTIAQLQPPGFPGCDRIRLLFRVDADRFLRLTVEDILTGDTLMENQAVVQLS